LVEVFTMRVSKRVRLIFALSALAFATCPASAEAPVRILATGVFATSLQALAAPFKAASGYDMKVTVTNAGGVASRIAAGEATDIVMSSLTGVDALVKQGVLMPNAIEIGRMRLGMAVPAQAPHPDLTSVDKFRTLLRSSSKVAYIDPKGGGTSGPLFENMFASMGVADEVHAKATLCADGAQVVEAVGSGRAAIGMTQASEIIGARDVAFGGYLPDEVNVTTIYSAARTRNAANEAGATALLAFLAGPTGAEHLRQAGWDVAKPRD
jgi:molybdate transport system substrate-binding protein